MKQRVGILTFLHNNNFGSALQAFALQKTVTELGFETEQINYAPSQSEKLRNLLTSGNSPRLILEGMQKRQARSKWEGARENAASFAPFYAEQMKLSPVCRDHSALAALAKSYDTLLCGSDQIWSPTWLNPAYFLDFAAKGQRKIAYAPSLGVKALPAPRKCRRMAKLLTGFDALSVREEEGARLLAQLSPGSKAAVMPDPVCLLTRDAWTELAQQPHRKHPYILCYFLGEKSENWERAARLADKTGLRVRVVPTTDEACRQQFEILQGLSPLQWLGYIDEAAVVCTDSFHAMTFSAIYHTPFEVFRRDCEDDPASRNSRVDQLLRALALDRDSEDIPWEQVTARLADMRQRGRDYLRRALEGEAT